jgi:hypothetical protein
MLFSRWLRNWLKQSPPRRPPGCSPQRLCKRPALERLEDRTLLAVSLSLNGTETLTAGANVNASNDAATTQEEMSVAINPTNPLNVAGFTHRGQGIAFVTMVAVHSNDGGLTWASTSIDGTVDGFAAATERFDPSIAFDARGNLFISYIESDAGNDRMLVAESTDGGATFPTVRTVETAAAGGLDKDSLATGLDPATGNQAVYVTYIQLSGPIVVAGSNNYDFGGPFTFTAPTVVSDAPNTDANRMPNVAVGPKGELYVVWHDVTTGKIMFDRDLVGLFAGGSTFGTDITVRTLNSNFFFYKVPAQPNRGIFAGPTIAVDTSGGPFNGRVYIAFCDLAATGGANNSDIFLVHSTDEGANWSTLDNTGNVASGTTTDFLPWVAVDPHSGSVNVDYYSSTAPSGASVNVMLAGSTDGGNTFATTTVTTATSNAGTATSGGADFLEYIGLAVRDGTAQALWSDDRTGVTPDLEAFTASASFSSTTGGGNTLLITGDDNGPTDDNIVLSRSAANPAFLVVTVNGTIQYTGLLASIGSIVVDSGQGNDSLTIDSSNGLISVPNGILYDGGTGVNTLQLTQTGGATQTSDTYSPGPNLDEGTDVITTSGTTQTVAFQNLAPVQDNVAATTATVNGTNAGNAINYTQGPGGGIFTGNTGLVTVDNLESYEFNNKTNLVINGLAGSDTINLNNQTTPAGSITVNAGDPTASPGDTLIVNGRVNATDTFTYTPATTTSDTGSVADTGLPTVNFTGLEHLVINGQNGGPGGAGDSLTITPSNLSSGQTEILTPGTTFDSGHVDFRDRPSGVNPTAVPLDFEALGVAGSMSFTDVGRFDNLIYNGTPLNDTFSVYAGGVVTLNDQIPVSTPSIITLTLAGLDGDDTFNVAGNNNLPGSPGIAIQGGDPSASDVLNFTGNGAGAVTVDLAAQTVTEAGFAAVSFSGVETVNVNAGGAAATVNGTAGNDNLTYTPTGTSAGTVTLAGLNTVFNFSNLTAAAGGLTVDPLGGTNTVTVNGTASNDASTAARSGTNTTVQVNALQTVTLPTADTQALVVLGGLGDDTLTVNSTAGPVLVPLTYDGGLGTDSLTLTGGTASSDTYTPGPQPGSGTSTIVFTSGGGGTQTVNFLNLEPVNDLVSATNLTVNATGARQINLVDGPTVNGTPTAQVNSGAAGPLEAIDFANKANVTVQAGGGDTATLTINAAASLGGTNLTVTGPDAINVDGVITTGTVTLSATGPIAEVTTDADADITATSLMLNAGTGIGTGHVIETQISNLQAQTGSGGIFLSNVAAGGNLNVSRAASANGDISLTVAGGNLMLVTPPSGATVIIAPGRTVTLNASGAIVGNGMAGVNDVAAANLAVTGASGIGLKTAVTAFAASVGGGGVFVTNTGAALGLATVGGTVGVTATGGAVTINTSGDLTVSSPVSTAGAAVTLTGGTDNAGHNILVNAAIGGSSAAVLGGTGADNVTVTATGATPLTVNGMGGGDALVVDFGALNAAVNVAETGGGTNLLRVNGPTTADSYTVTAAQVTDSSPTQQKVTYAGVQGLTLTAGDAGNFFQVQGTAAGTPVTLNSGGGADGVQVGSAMDATGVVDNLGAALTVNLGGGSNGLVVNDMGSSAADTATITGATVTVSRAALTVTVNYTAAGGSLDLYVATGAGNDLVNVRGTAANATTIVTTGAGNDGVMVGSASDATGVIDNLLGLLFLDLGGGVNGLVINDMGGTTTDGVVLTATSVRLGKMSSLFAVSYAATGGTLFLNVATGSGNDFVNVQSTAANAATTVATGAGNDLIGVSTNNGAAINVTVNGGPPTGGPGGDTLIVADAGGSAAGTVIHVIPSGPGNGMVQVLHPNMVNSTIAFFDIEQLLTSPAAS